MVKTQSANSEALPPRAASRHGVIPRRETRRDATAREIAGYIAELSGELAQLAAGADLELLAYFLDMARIESELAARHDGEPVVAHTGT